MFNASRYKAMYERFLGPLSQEIQIAINNGVSFVPTPATKAFVTRYRESDLISGGSIQLGDLRVIINWDDMPAAITDLNLDDRLIIDGRFYSIVHFDKYTRKMGDTHVAIEMACRGGGVYEAPEDFTLIAENGDQLITEDGAFDIVSG